eukprot:113508_1
MTRCYLLQVLYVIFLAVLLTMSMDANESNEEELYRVTIIEASVKEIIINNNCFGARLNAIELASVNNYTATNKEICGMGVINTIANAMGNTEFLGGISKYLEEYQFDVATSEELGAVLDEVSPDISLLMDSFISQEGFPLITIHTQVDQSDENEFIFTIDQRRFVKQGPDFYEDANYANNNPFVTQNMINNFADQLWRVPMVWRDANGDIFDIGTENDIMIERELQSTK